MASDALKEILAASYAGQALYLSLHSGDPGTTGDNEASGGSPAYARQAITWNAGTEDGVTSSDAIDVDLPAGTYTYVGIWDAVTAGTFLDSAEIASFTFSGQGIYRVTLTYSQA